MVRTKEYSEQTAQEIDTEVKRIIDLGFQTAKDIIEENRDKLEVIAQALLDYETLDGEQVTEILRTGHFTPPSQPPPTDPPTGALAATPLSDAKSTPPKLDPGFGSPAPATA